MLITNYASKMRYTFSKKKMLETKNLSKVNFPLLFSVSLRTLLIGVRRLNCFFFSLSLVSGLDKN
jgi:hypothetical protein